MKKYLHFFITGAIGNTLEWYDYAVFNCLALVIAKNFFPVGHSSLLLTFVIFAIGFISRPFGALLFGYLGDRFNRKYSLIIALVVMALPTTLLGLLPTYQTIGWLAPIMLTFIRILQGLSVGGELPGNILLLGESADKSKAFVSSFPVAGSFLGFSLGSLVTLFLHLSLSESQISAYGWRIPFVLSLALMGCCLYIRKNIRDPHVSNKEYFINIKTILKANLRKIIKITCIEATPATFFYVILVFFTTSITHFFHYSPTTALIINTILMFTMFLIAPVGGVLVDLLGVKKVILGSAILLLLLSYPTFFLFYKSYTKLSITFFFLLVMGIGIYFGAAATILIQSFSARYRFTSSALAHAMAFSLFGGLTPAIVTFLLSHFSNANILSIYLISCCLLSIFSIINLKNEAQHDP